MESIIWHMALIIGSAVFLIGVIYLISRKKRTRTDYIKAVAIELLASWFLWLPHELYKEVTVDGRFLHILESVLTAVIRTFNVFSIEAYEKVIYPGSEELTSAFAIVRVLVSISVALFSFGWIMTFFDGPLQRIKLFFNRNEPTFVFPEFNEKTASIARSVDRDFGNKANIVFLAHEEVPESSKSEIEEIGGMVMKTSLPLMIHNLVKHSGEINVYIFGRDDEDNLKQLEDAFDEGMVDKCRKIHFFVELTETPWALCDDYVSRKLGDHDADVVVNFVRTEENAVYHILWRHSFLKHVHIERDGMKKAEVLIAGVNARSIEMIRTILPLTQMPGYSLSLTVLDEGENLAKLQAQMPSIVFNKPYRHWGDAVYSITYLENVALDEVLPDSVSEAISSFTYAYVNTGDDIRNVTLAIRLDHERQRAAVSEEADAAVGYEIMVDASRIEEKMLKRDSLRHILFSGNFEKVYSREFSSMSEFETASIAVHEQRQKEKVAKAEVNFTTSIGLRPSPGLPPMVPRMPEIDFIRLMYECVIVLMR